MSGLSDLFSQKFGKPADALKTTAALSLTGGGSFNPKDGKKDWSVLTGATQKKEQLAAADAQEAAMKAASDAQLTADATAAEQKRRASIMPIADDAAAAADKKRKIAAAAASGGRQSTILTGQRLGD
jgi:hypothetical protein